MTWIWIAALAMGLTAVTGDLVRRSIPNWLTATGVVSGLACRGLTQGWRGLALSAAGAMVGFLVLMPLHLNGAMGGGDVKLMAAFGALLGPSGILLTALFGTVAGGLWAAAWLAIRPGARAVPYAPAIVLGAWLSLFGGSV